MWSLIIVKMKIGYIFVNIYNRNCFLDSRYGPYNLDKSACNIIEIDKIKICYFPTDEI